MGNHRLETLSRLVDEIKSRRGASPEQSYTAALLAAGIDTCAKKLGEEAVETALAAVKGEKSRITSEAADLLYHLLVVLEASGIGLADVMAELERREGTSGLAEKASRGQRR